MSQTGSIQLNIFYNNGDRVDNNGLVLKFYQDTNSTLFKTVSPDSYPTVVNSFPLGHTYKMDVYRESMYAGSEYIDMKDTLEKVNTFIPLDAGLRFNVFYNDAETPISNATISIKSYDGMQWAQGNTDDQGDSNRFWLQSSIRDGDYYVATFSIGKSLNFTYPSNIGLSPGDSRDIKIVTPWISIVESPITVSVYTSTTQKVKPQDGNYMVVLSDLNGNHVADSVIDSHGQATFSKLKVGYYDVHVIKKSTYQAGTEVALESMLVTGNQLQFPIFLQSTNIKAPVNLQNGTVRYIVNGTTTVIPPFVNLGQQESCNCVIFRIDDIQDYFVRASQLAILNLFTLKHQDLTLGIVTNYTGNDKIITETIKQGIRKNIFFPVLHGYDHIDYSLLDSFDQLQSISLAEKKMEKLFGNTSDIFIPPYNHFNNGTLDSLKQLGVKIISAGSLKDPLFYHFSKDHKTLDPLEIYHISQGSDNPMQRAAEINYFSTSSERDIMHDINYNLKTVGYAVVTLHPQDITTRGSNGHFTNTNHSVNQTQIQNLGHLIDRLDAEGIRMTNFYDVAGLSPRIFPVAANSSITYPDPSVTNIYTLGKSSTGVALNPDTNMVYVTNSKSNTVSVINGSLNAVYDTIGVGDLPVGIAINPKTNMLYVVDSGSGTVSIIDGSTNTISDRLAIESTPYGVAVNPALNMVYFIDPTVPAVDFVDGYTNKIVNTVNVNGNPQRIAVDPATNMIYVTNSKSDAITVIDGSTKTVSDTIHAGNGTMPLAIAVNSATNMIYLTNSKSDAITVIDGSTKKVTNTLHLGNGDTHLTISINPPTNMIYVTNSKSDSVSVIDGSAKSIVGTINLGSGNFPAGITYNDLTNTLYVSNINSGTLSVIGSNTYTNSPLTVPEFSLMTLIVFSISVSILVFITRFKMLNLTR
jgi:YVTN family beta-propeller protein